MARRARAEVAGGLYHVITRGNNRRQMFDAPEDYEKFLSLLAVQKARLPFFLYAYCLFALSFLSVDSSVSPCVTISSSFSLSLSAMRFTKSTVRTKTTTDLAGSACVATSY